MFSKYALFLSCMVTAALAASDPVLPGGFIAQVSYSGSECSRALSQGASSVGVFFQTSQRWDDPQFWRSFLPVLKKLLPGSTIYIDADSSTFMVVGKPTLLDARVTLVHPQSQIRIEWNPSLERIDFPIENSELESTPPNTGSRRHYWDAPQDSDPIKGRSDRWNPDASDEIKAPRGSNRGNMAP